MSRLVVAVGSTNPVKARAVRDGFAQVFRDREIEVRPVAVESGVADQPQSSDETRRGAEQRARVTVTAVPGVDFWAGVEGGVEDGPHGLLAFAWIFVLSRDRVGQARTGTFALPPAVAKLVRSGHELGEADDIVFGRSNSKQEEGAIGLLTDGAIDRAGLYAHGVVLALAPFIRRDLYPVIPA